MPKPTIGQPNWGADLNEHLDAIEATAGAALPASEKGSANGVAPLDAGSRVPEASLPAHVAEAALSATYGRRSELSVNVKAPAYGAAGDNVTDDTAAIQAAVDAAEAAGGGQVLVPTGTYLCTAPIRLGTGVMLIGDGPASVLRFNWTAATTGSHILNKDQSAGNSDVGVLNLKVRGGHTGDPFGSATSPATGIHFRYGQRVRVEGVTVENVAGISIAIQGVRDFTVSRNIVRQGGRDGIFVTSFGTTATTDGTIAGNVIDQVGDDGIALNSSPSDSGTAPQIARIAVTGNSINLRDTVKTNMAGRGVIVYGATDVTLAGNTISNTFAQGILVDQDTSAGTTWARLSIVGNTITNAGIIGDGSQPRHAIELLAGSTAAVSNNVLVGSRGSGVLINACTNLALSGNHINGAGVSTTSLLMGIDLVNTCTDITLTGNTVTKANSAGIRVAAVASTRLTFTGNTCWNNGQTATATGAFGSGFYINSDGKNLFTGNHAYDSQGTKTQDRGFALTGTGTAYWQGNIATDNEVTNITTGTVVVQSAFFAGQPATRVTGWGSPTGTATRTGFATSTVTTAELAERVKALVDDLKTYGILGG